ncbi:MAG TPA: hypothetical protein VGQ12_02855 [Candidatus Angelobacter sp.]|jgi:hypothetical protein|nr:hypothetical protein [Candidatus Angelobacter sp.]
MKTTLIRTLAIAMLATSISAFAQTDDKKSENAAQCNITEQNNLKQNANGPGTQGKSNNPQGDDQEQQEQDRTLMSIYG